MPARARCMRSKSELARLVLSNLLGSENKQMVNVRQDHCSMSSQFGMSMQQAEAAVGLLLPMILANFHMNMVLSVNAEVLLPLYICC